MASRLALINREAQDLSGLHTALDQITSALEEILALPPRLQDQPLARGSKQAPTNPIRMLPTDGSHLAILHSLNVISGRDDVEIPEEVIRSLQSERETQLHEHEKSSASSSSQTLAEVLGQSEKQLSALLDSLYCNSKFNTINMSDPIQDSQLNKLEEDVEKLGKGIASLDAPAPPEEAAKRDAFVSKWSSR
jgi:hypothetical protein